MWYQPNGFFMLDLDYSSSSYMAYNDDDADSMTWHARLGHIGKDRMARLPRKAY